MYTVLRSFQISSPSALPKHNKRKMLGNAIKNSHPLRKYIRCHLQYKVLQCAKELQPIIM